MAAVSIGTNAAAVVAAGRARKSTLVQNVHASQDLYIDYTNAVTTTGATGGVKVPAGQSVRIFGKEPIWGIASGAATDVRYIEEF